MATPLFQTQVSQFLRRVGQGNITITYDGSNNPVFTPDLTKYSTDQIYDYYQLSGQSLYRALEKFGKKTSTKNLPSFERVLSAATLTTGAYTFTESIEKIIEPVTVWTSTDVPIVKKPAYQIPDNVLELCLNDVGIRKISSDYPGYYLRNKTINVLPSSKNRISLSYILSIPRIKLTDHATNFVDIWPSNYSSMLIDGMVMLALGDSGNSNLEQYYYQKLSNDYRIQASPTTNQNNSLIEQQ